MILLFFILWVIFNGNFTLEIAIFGLVITAVIFLFTCKFMDHSLSKEIKIYKNFFKGIKYVAVLIVEIVKANLAVMKLILTEKEEVRPRLVTFRTPLKTDTARAFLSNAITLTPGTITADLEGDRLTVHALDETMAEGIEELVFQKLLQDMEE